MRFRTEDVTTASPFALVYRRMDHAFDVEPKPEGGGASLLVNDLQLEVDEDGHVLYVWGLCPEASWREKLGVPPRARAAVLVAELPDDFVRGMSMRSSKQTWPVVVDRQSGWVRVGEGSESDDVVEFASGMIAILRGGELVGLCLRPRELPMSG